MDGGACSRDAFRMPSAGEELTTPFSGFVVRYGHSARLAKSTAAIAGLAAELPPRMEEPYRVIYFVVTDQTRTTIATLRAVLKEGLSHPSPLPKALVIDELHTLEVFRKQGLATSLTNFVKGIAEAHEIGLYARCGVYTRTFWELRGFQEETIPEVLRACGRDGEDDMIMAPAATLMRAGPAYTEYQPANGERLSIIRPFYHSQCGVVYLDPSTGSSLAAGSELSLAGGSRFLHQGSAECGGVGSYDDHGDAVSGASPAASSAAAAAVAAAAGATENSANCAEGGGGCGAGGTVLPPSRVLTNERLARHDEEEEAKCPRPSVPWDTLARTETVADMILSDDKGTAAAKAALAQRNLAGGWPGVGAASGVGLLPPPPPPPPPQSFVGPGGETGGPAAAAAVAATSGVTSTVAGFLGYRPSDHQIGAVTTGPWDSAWSGAAGGAADGDRRALAAKGLLAIPTSGCATDVVDLTGNKSLDEEDEEQMQLAIAMSLSAVEAGTHGGGGGGGGIDESSDGGVSSGAVCGGGEVSADDTETEEDVDSSAQLSGEDAREPGEAATTAAAAAAAALPSTSRFAPAGSGRGRQSGSSGGHTSSGTGSGSDRCASDGVREGHGGQGGKGSVEARHREDGHGRDGGANGDGDNSLRRIRRRRDESGASTPGEQSPGGVDGGGGAAEGTVGTGLDDAAPAASARGEGGGGGGDGAGGDPGGDGSAQVGIAPATSGLGSDALAATATSTRTTTATGGSKSSCSSRPSPQPCPDAAASPSPSTSSSSFSFSLEPRPRDNQAAAAAAAVGVRAGQMVLGQRDLNSAMVSCSQQEQRQQQEQRSSGDKNGSSMDTGAPGGGVYPSVPSAAPAAAAAPGGAPDFGGLGEGAAGTVQGVGGGVGAGGGGFVSDDIEASDIMMRDFGVGADVLDGGGGGGDVGRLDDKLITVAGWQGEDNDEELRRVMEASMHSHEQEMIQRATQESQEAAAAAAEAASIATAPTAASMHLPHPPHPPQSAPYALTTLGSGGGGGGGDGPGGGGAFNPRGGGPDAAVLPDFGSREPAGNGAIRGGDGGGANEGTAFPGTGGGAGADGFQARSGGGAAGSSAEAAVAAAAAAAVAAWADGYDDGEVLPFVGKGKGKSRCRD